VGGLTPQILKCLAVRQRFESILVHLLVYGVREGLVVANNHTDTKECDG
jgi:hypothetical protein